MTVPVATGRRLVTGSSKGRSRLWRWVHRRRMHQFVLVALLLLLHELPARDHLPAARPSPAHGLGRVAVAIIAVIVARARIESGARRGGRKLLQSAVAKAARVFIALSLQMG